MRGINIKTLFINALNTNINSHLMLLEDTMQSALDYEHAVDSDKAQKIREVLRESEKQIQSILYGSPENTKGLFSEKFSSSKAIPEYVLLKAIEQESFGDFIQKDYSVEFDKESIEEMIKILQGLI